MTVTIANALPAPAATKATAHATADTGGASFHDMLAGDAGQPNARHGTSHAHRSRHDMAHHVPHGHGRSRDAASESDATAEETDTTGRGRLPRKVAKVAATPRDIGETTQNGPADQPSASVAHERLPLLMSLQEIDRAAAAVPQQHDHAGPAGNKEPANEDRADGPTIGLDPRRGEQKQAKPGLGLQPAAFATSPSPTDPAAATNGAAISIDGSADGPSPSGSAGTNAMVTARSEHAARPQGQEPVTVVSSQSFPAPATPGLDPTIARLAGAIAADGMAQPASFAAAATLATAQQGPVAAHTLKIELHPAELGVVNARLHLVAEQLSIELMPDTQEAYHRLSSDSDAIARALRDLGYDVGKISVMQPQIASTPAARADASGSATASPDRDPSSFQSGGDGNASHGNHSQGSRDNEVHHFGRAAEPGGGRAGDGLFI